MVLLIFCRTKNTFSRGKYYPYYESCNKCNSVYNPNANPKNEVAYKKQTNKQTNKKTCNGPFNFLQDKKILRSITVILTSTILSIYNRFQGENIVLTMSHAESVTPSTNLRSLKRQHHFSTFYIMDQKRKRNRQSYSKE